MSKTAQPYGSWSSPVSAETLVAGAKRLGLTHADGSSLFWVESRPEEKGRGVIMERTASGDLVERTTADFNVRSRVHEYGGGEFTASQGIVYFSHDVDSRVYRAGLNDKPLALTPEGKLRFADLKVDPTHNCVIAIQEDHSAGGEPTNKLVSFSSEAPGEIAVIAEGEDFYSSPAISPDGNKVAFLSWEHPNMPWDSTKLWVAERGDDKKFQEPQLLLHSESEAIFQPEFSPTGELFFVGDRTGWWNIYKYDKGTPTNICPQEAEFGLPGWLFGFKTYTFYDENNIICCFKSKGYWRLGTLEVSSQNINIFPPEFSSLQNPLSVDGHLAFSAGTALQADSIYLIDKEKSDFEVVRASEKSELEHEDISEGEWISFPSKNGRTAFAYYYRPRNSQFNGTDGEKPPLLVKSHGGPTSGTSNTLNMGIQFWTSRGFAVVDVDYGGSTGYGRKYREELKGNWGIVDVEDCEAAAQYLIDKGAVDPKRVVIRGGSAGGYTTLASLAFRDLYASGASYYGVADLELLAKDTHKFESRYLDSLIGEYPKDKVTYEQRSPVNHTDKLSCPVIFLQGSEDKVVPPNQAEVMVEALKKKGIDVDYVLFEGEQHGFRQAENIKASISKEIQFYGKALGFSPSL